MSQNPTIYDVAKDVGRRWADMAPEVKQRYAHLAEMGRRKYDQGPFINDAHQRFLHIYGPLLLSTLRQGQRLIHSI